MPEDRENRFTAEFVQAAFRRMRRPEELARMPELVELARRALPNVEGDDGQRVQALLRRAIEAVGRSQARVVRRGPEYLRAILTEVYLEGQRQNSVFPRHGVGSDTTFSVHLRRACAVAAAYLARLADEVGLATPPAAAVSPAALPGPPPGGRGLRLPLTSFVGRTRELALLAEYLAGADAAQGRPPALITLVGPAGAGKSRLALEAAAAARPAFARWVFFVPLAGVTDPALVLPAIAAALPLGDDPQIGAPATERLRDFIGSRRLLLLLDNFDRLGAAARELVGLLEACPRLTALVTSRVRLRVEGEHLVRVAPLPAATLPERPLSEAALVEAALEQPAVRLFRDRARAADDAFALDAGNAADVALLCRRLDGLPLAIELAAANSRGRSPADLLRAQDRFLAMRFAHQPTPPWHLSLSEAVAWSYDALAPAMQRLFRRCAVFHGEFGAAAATAITTDDAAEEGRIAPLLAALAEAHLLEVRGELAGERRYAMLLTIRRFAWRLLRAEPADWPIVRERHTRHYVALARAAEAALLGSEQVATLDRIDRELDNLRAVLRRSAASRRPAGGLALVGPLWMFWSLRGYVREGRRWLGWLLPGDDRWGTVPLEVQAQALFCAAYLAAFEEPTAAVAPYGEARRRWVAVGDRRREGWCALGLGQAAVSTGDLDAAAAHLQEALALFRATADQQGAAWALTNLGRLARLHGDAAGARRHLEAALRLWEEVDDAWGRATTLGFLANEEYVAGRLAAAARRYEQSIAQFRRLGFRVALAWRLLAQGDVRRLQRDSERAAAAYEEARALFAEQHVPDGLAWVQHNLAYGALRAGLTADAARLLRESLPAFWERGHAAGCLACLVAFADLARATGEPRQATRLLGAADALLGSGHKLEPADQAEYGRVVAAVRAALPAAAWDRLTAEGRARSLADAVQMALQLGVGTGRTTARPAPPPHPGA